MYLIKVACTEAILQLRASRRGIFRRAPVHSSIRVLFAHDEERIQYIHEMSTY